MEGSWADAMAAMSDTEGGVYPDRSLNFGSTQKMNRSVTLAQASALLWLTTKSAPALLTP